jgi:general stress protein 26
MGNIENLKNKEAIFKLQNLVDDIMICLFCTNLKTDNGSTCRPMTALKVCDQGSIWFFSEKKSEKNKEISADKMVQLFFSYPSIGSYLIVNGEAEIILDKTKMEDSWKHVAKIWFKEGINDPNISIIKVTPSDAYYWDLDGNRMINFLKSVVSVVTGANLVTGNQGALTV